MVTAVSGQSVWVDCQCDSKPVTQPSDVHWKKQGQRKDKDHLKVDSIGGSRLFHRPISLTDHGRYTCLCSNHIKPYNFSPFYAHARKDVSLNVLYKPGKADITLPKVSLVGTRSILRCSSEVKGNPSCVYVWMKDEKEVGRGSTLIFHHTLLSHSGLYTCVPSNLIGQGHNSTALFTVFEPPSSLDPPTNSSSPIEVSADQLSPVVLTCSVRGKPPPEIRWFKNNHLIEVNEVTEEEEEEEKEDGEKDVNHNNNNNNSNNNYNNNINNSNNNNNNSNNNNNNNNNNNSNNKDDGKSNSDMLSYSFSSFSRSIDEFSYNITSVITIRGTKSVEDAMWRLSVKDAGNYTCIASNVVASARKMKTVKVAVKFPPEVTSKPIQALVLGGVGSIHFTIHSYPPPSLQWFNGSTPLEENNSMLSNNDSTVKVVSYGTTPHLPSQRWSTALTLTHPNKFQASLNIEKVSLHDLQTYTIRVYNEVAEISSAVDVIAAVKPEPPYNLTCTFVSWDRVDMEWRGGGDGGLMQQFVVLAMMVDGGGKRRQMVVTNTTSVCFEGLERSKKYKMVAYAENQVGRSDPSNMIEVTLKDLKLNSPSSVHYSQKDHSITINLPPTLHNLTPSIYSDHHDDNLTRKIHSRDWGEFCARVEIFDGSEWRVKYPCVREVKVKLEGEELRVDGKNVKVEEVRVSICSERRPDICSEGIYSHSGIVSAETMLAVGCVCGSVVGVLVLVVLCLVVKRIKRKRKHIQTKVTVHSENIKENNNNNFWDENQYTKTSYSIDDSPAVNVGWLNINNNNNKNNNKNDNNDHINTNNNNNNNDNINKNTNNNINFIKTNQQHSNKKNGNCTPVNNIYNNNNNSNIDLLNSNNNLHNINNNSSLHLHHNNLNSTTTSTFHASTFTPDLNHSRLYLNHPQPHQPHLSQPHLPHQPHLSQPHQPNLSQPHLPHQPHQPHNPHIFQPHHSHQPHHLYNPHLNDNNLPSLPYLILPKNHPHFPISSPTLDLTPNFSPYISEDEHNSTMHLMHSPSINHVNTFKNDILGKKKKIIHEVVV